MLYNSTKFKCALLCEFGLYRSKKQGPKSETSTKDANISLPGRTKLSKLSQ